MWFPLGNFTLPISLLNNCWKKIFSAVGLYQMSDFRILWRFCSLSAEHKVSQGGMSVWAWLSCSLICKVDFWLCTPPFLPKSVLLTSSEQSEKDPKPKAALSGVFMERNVLYKSLGSKILSIFLGKATSLS